MAPTATSKTHDYQTETEKPNVLGDTMGDRWSVTKPFVGLPNYEQFEMVRNPHLDHSNLSRIPHISDGEIYVEALYQSVDPYMRIFTGGLKTPFTMIGEGVYRVKASRDSDYPKGEIICAKLGWVKSAIIRPKQLLSECPMNVRCVPDCTKDLSPSHLLGALGMPGCTAYFALFKVLRPKAGETLVVNAAAGAVGSLVGQLAKIIGCKVIGFSGSDTKCDYLKSELGFDFAFNYKKVDVQSALAKASPEGIDCFFDNVGGPSSALIVNNHMRSKGRVVVVGVISEYNYIGEDHKTPRVPAITMSVLVKQLKIEGFVVFEEFLNWNEAIEYLANLYQEGKLKFSETVLEGFQNMPQAFIDLFSGKHKGKVVVKI